MYAQCFFWSERDVPSYLINYLLEHAKEGDWTLTVADVSFRTQRKDKGSPGRKAIEFDMHNDALLSGEVSRADLVISMLPAHMHLPVALECVKQKNLVTASYVTKEMHDLDSEARQNDIIILNECGLILDWSHARVQWRLFMRPGKKEPKIKFFKSFTGGLVAPESKW